jgi:hypothetical protein
MLKRVRFLPCHEHKVLIVTVENQKTSAERVTAAEYRPILDQNPMISTYAPVTDLRGFVGYIGIADLGDIAADFRAARIALGYEPFLSVPQVMIFDKNSHAYASNLLELVRATSNYPELVMAAFDIEQAWEIVAPGTKVPHDVEKFLSRRRFFRRWFA